jgi:hypothetical protein
LPHVSAVLSNRWMLATVLPARRWQTAAKKRVGGSTSGMSWRRTSRTTLVRLPLSGQRLSPEPVRLAARALL